MEEFYEDQDNDRELGPARDDKFAKRRELNNLSRVIHKHEKMINRSGSAHDIEVAISSFELELSKFETLLPSDISGADRIKLLNLRNRIMEIAARLDQAGSSVVVTSKSYPPPAKWAGSPGRFRVKPEDCVSFYKREYADLISAGFKLKDLRLIDKKLYNALMSARHRGLDVPD